MSFYQKKLFANVLYYFKFFKEKGQ